MTEKLLTIAGSLSAAHLREKDVHMHNTAHGVLMQGSSNCGGSGGLNALGEPDMPPGFGPVLAASTRKGKGRGPVRMPNLYEAFGDR